MRVEKLQQQGESLETPGQLSHQLFLRLLHHFAESPPFQGSIGNLARMIIAIAQYPRFANKTIGQRDGEQIGQAPTAP